MPFPQRLLNPGESVAADLHPHWLYFFGPAIALVASLLLGVVVLIADPGAFVNWLTLVALVASALWLLVRYLRWITTNLTITNDRIIYRYGLIAKQGMEIPIERVNNVSFRQGILERIFGNGDLTIESGGEDGEQFFSHVRKPAEVQRLIHAQMDVNEHRRFPPPAAATNVAEQLERLEGLLQRGTLTRAEFEAQKAKLLGG